MRPSNHQGSRCASRPSRVRPFRGMSGLRPAGSPIRPACWKS
ncbi:Uncharacterised protein [Amycolatopsis camponoti]|uniref:Uncharacterized protein n=1 Tax=Amycolatopsis camponoti TaxID=2606593 RepID=A0A6I8MB16_9PSEU|nr:Uncharacterised protein [Amycolatopsis camponoti]